MRILMIHGLGRHEPGTWEGPWEETIRAALPWVADDKLIFEPFNYDEFFEDVEISAWEATRAVAKLLGGGIVSGIGGWFGARGGRPRGVSSKIKYSAGYVVAWLEDQAFRKEVRTELLKKIAEFKPDVILAHSLGSLISYDMLTDWTLRGKAGSAAANQVIAKAKYVTLGSQLGNVFVRRNLTPGRIAPLDVDWWYHLYNEHDSVFAAEVNLPEATNFTQLDTPFNIPGVADHDATEYLGHGATVAGMWEPIARDHFRPRRRTRARRKPKAKTAKREARRRAVLVGINDYPHPADRLEGCVNDVYLMSAVLQECGFKPEEIRIVLNDRATAQGIVERMQWLMDAPEKDDQLVFYFSGHGAQLPTYGEGDAVDRMDETLVPYNFDWSPATCVTDDTICDLYSQLPFGTKLAMIFDCCHSGGIHRDGGLTVRGLTPPDDIRHRAMEWDAKNQMWRKRKLNAITENFAENDDDQKSYCGADGSVLKLGRAMLLRGTSHKQYSALQGDDKEIVGPYLPMILEACREEQFAYEYRHGVTSYGAFTYSLTQILRSRKQITFADLVSETKQRLDDMNFDQEPAILGPKKLVNAQVPWMTAKKPTRRKKRTRKKSTA